MPKAEKTEIATVDDNEELPSQWVNREQLQPWLQNPRVNTDAIGPVAQSILRFGFGAPIVAWKLDHPMVIAGHTRLAAAIQLGLAEVPVRFMPHLTLSEAKAYALADNKLGEIAEWDDKVLVEVIQELAAEEFDLSGLGWADDELKVLKDQLAGFLPGQSPDPSPSLDFDHVVEVKCSTEFLNSIRDTLHKWAAEKGVEVQIA